MRAYSSHSPRAVEAACRAWLRDFRLRREAARERLTEHWMRPNWIGYSRTREQARAASMDEWHSDSKWLVPGALHLEDVNRLLVQASLTDPDNDILLDTDAVNLLAEYLDTDAVGGGA